MLGLADMDSKTGNNFQLCKKLSRDMEDIKKNQKDLLEMKIKMSEVRTTVDEINS